MNAITDHLGLHPAVTAAVQLRTLGLIRQRVAQAVAEGRRPVVEVDLDLCALRPAFRTREALRRVGAEFGVPEFLQPEALPRLPGYSDEAWLAFILELGLPPRHPGLLWVQDGRAVRPPGSPFELFHRLYWTTEWLGEDEPTAGLGLFVDWVEAAGGRVVFLSGRWLLEQVAPSLECLRRAGIPEPALIIGNPRHESFVPTGQPALSDAAVKAWRQEEIRARYGVPVVVVDDRVANRQAVQNANAEEVLGIGIAVPGFTADVSIRDALLRVSTFEDFAQTIESPPHRPHLGRKFPVAGWGWAWGGLHSGLGRNGLSYHLPRRMPEKALLPAGEAPFPAGKTAPGNGTVTEEDLLERWRGTIPATELAAMDEALEAALSLGGAGLGAPVPNGAESRAALRHSLTCAWLHSRDLDVLMRCLGYPLDGAGRHDLREEVAVAEIRRLLFGDTPADRERVARGRYDRWLIRWAEQLDPSRTANVSFLNPHLLVDLCGWNPAPGRPQNAMDVHRLSDHHEGDGGERFDPLEAGINNLLHQREGRYGVRKEPVETWARLRAQVATESGAASLAKNSAACQALRDAVALAAELELVGWLTPWSLAERQ